MSTIPNDPLLQVETTCGSLLYELQIIWDEVGEPDLERDKMLLELEQECLEVYRRKVDHANRSRAQLRQAIADSEADLAAICSAMGERPVHIRQSDQNPGSLKEELKTILPQVEEMRKRKCDRKKQIVDVLEQIHNISTQIYMPSEYTPSNIVVDETDLSLRKLEELQRKLQALQTEKSERLKQVLDHLNTLHKICLVLAMDFKQQVTDVHPSLCDSEGAMSITSDTIERLGTAIQNLREIKLQRMQRLQDLATSMLELWNLMDTPIEEQQKFQNVTCNIAAAEHEITEPNMLSMDFINYVEAEVSRLEELKASKMKELLLKKRMEMEEICRKTHMILESDSSMEIAIEAIESGTVDPAYVLEQIELQIAKLKEEAFSRKEILEKVEKWLAACEEESWLEEYNNDENRYNAGRGGHLILKRAEKARAILNKLPGMVEALASKTKSWEDERGVDFIYDGVPLLSMLEEYNFLREEKEQERKRQRDQKKLQGQLIAEQEALFGSKPSPMKAQGGKKLLPGGGASSKRLSMGGAMLQTPKAADGAQSAKVTPNTRQNKKSDRSLFQNDQFEGLSAGRRGLDIAGLPVNKHAHEGEPMRRPFSPISSTESCVPNHQPNILEDMNNRKHSGILQKALSSNNLPYGTPVKTIPAGGEQPFHTPVKTVSSSDEDDENVTPKARTIPIPATPSTISVPMQTATTPAPPLPLSYSAAKSVEEIQPEEIEYSFEEKRAGFVLPRPHLKPVVQA